MLTQIWNTQPFSFQCSKARSAAQNVFQKIHVFFFAVPKIKQGQKPTNWVFRVNCEKTPSFPEKKNKHETFALSPSQTRQIQIMRWSKKKVGEIFYSPTFLRTVERLHFPIGPKFYQILWKERRLFFFFGRIRKCSRQRASSSFLRTNASLAILELIFCVRIFVFRISGGVIAFNKKI